MSPEGILEKLEGPALERPAGITPGPLNQGQHAVRYALVILSSIICTLAVVVRLASRYSLQKISVADVLIVGALV